MKILIVAYYTLLRNLRDAKTMLALIIFPVIMIFIIGTAIGSLDTLYTPTELERVQVGIYAEEQNDFFEQLEDYLATDQLQELIEIETINSYDEGFQRLKAGELEAFIYFPSDFLAQYERGEKGNIQLFKNKEVSIVQPLLESYVQTLNTQAAITQLGAAYVPLEMKSSINETKIVTEGKMAKGIDYYSITTLMQTLLIGSVIGIFAITKDASNHTIRRMISMPVRDYQVYIGKILGSTVTLFITAVCVYLFTKYMYQANWNGDIVYILLVLFLFTLTSISLGMFVTRLINGAVAPILIMVFFMMIFTLTSGGFDPRVGPIREAIGKFTPSYYAQQGIFHNIYGEGAVTIQSSILILSLYSALLIILTLITRRRKVV